MWLPCSFRIMSLPAFRNVERSFHLLHHVTTTNVTIACYGAHLMSISNLPQPPFTFLYYQGEPFRFDICVMVSSDRAIMSNYVRKALKTQSE